MIDTPNDMLSDFKQPAKNYNGQTEKNQKFLVLAILSLTSSNLNKFSQFQNLYYSKFCEEQIILYTKIVSDSYFWSKFSYADLY